MKTKQLSIFLWITLPLLTIGNNFKTTENIIDLQNFIEETINFKETIITTEIPYDIILKSLEKHCNNESITQAKNNLENILPTRKESINKKSKENILNERFNNLKDRIINTDKTEEKVFCNQKYFLFSLLETTQLLYKEKETSPFLQQIENEHKSTNTIEFNFIGNTKGLPKDKKENISQLAKKYLTETITDLYNLKILNKRDIKTLNNKININYIQSCDTTRWSFHVMQNKKTKEIVFKEINLNFAYCESDHSETKLQRHAKQILAHELGHYVYFFKDKNPNEFSEICRSNWKINCLETDFISNYATTAKEEDYAESFAYRYIHWSKETDHSSAPLDNPIERRTRYFRRLFEEIEEEDDDDNDN